MSETLLTPQEVETIYTAYETVLGLDARTIKGRRAIVSPIYEAVIAARVATAQHEHYWIDARDDETGWHCAICGITEYPGGELDPEDEVESPSPEGLTEAERDIRERHAVVHRPGIHGEESWCDEDNRRQPCDTQVLIGIIDAARLRSSADSGTEGT